MRRGKDPTPRRKTERTHEVDIGEGKKATVGGKLKKPSPPLFHPKALKALTDLENDDSASLELKVVHARKMSCADYVTDPDENSVVWHYEREDRPWKALVAGSTFKYWSQEDSWADKREAFWNEVEAKLLHARAEQIAIQRLKEIDELTSARDLMKEYLVPLRDSHGDVKRYPMKDKKGDPHEYAGLPRYPLALPGMDRFVRMWLDMDKQLMLKRGEVTDRTQRIEDSKQLTPIDPVANALSFSRDDLQAMARILLRKRQPELALEADGEEIDGESPRLDETGDG